MNKKIYLFSLILLVLMFVSCEETEEVGRYDNWRERNEVFIDSLENVYETAADHGGLERFSLVVAPSDFIYYKKKTPVVSDVENQEIIGRRPTTASTVTVFYKGMNILRERFDGFFGEDPNVDNPDGGNVDVSVGETEPSRFAVAGVVTGWQEALQHMTVGERWEVYIPWEYGYGNRDQKDSNTNVVTIRAYSTLIFDIQLLDSDYLAEEE